MAVLVCALGDLALDVIVRPARALEPDADTPAVTSVGAGGQAANVAAWTARLGGRARFVGVRSGDGAGRLAAEELARRGVELAGPVLDGRGGVVVSVVGPAGERTMASDRGVSAELRPDALRADWFSGCDWLYVSGYALLASPAVEAATAAARLAREAGARVAVDCGAWTLIEELGSARFRERLAGLRADLVLANEREREALGGELDAPSWVLKRGAAGIVVRHASGELVELPAVATEVVDTTGAGDALAAGFLVGGPELGLQAAAQCVAKLGAQP